MKTIGRLFRLNLYVAMLSCPFLMKAANSTTSVSQVVSSVEVTAGVDYEITGETPFALAGSVNLVNTEHAVLRISKIKPSKVKSEWLDYIYINGEKAVDGTNCQVKMYNRGTIIFPYSNTVQPLTCYTERNYGGESCSTYTEGHSGGYMKTLNSSTLNNRIRSFKLKRGYMVTFAIGTGGWGYSRCFIADKEDLEVASLPDILDHRISSYRLFKWFNFSKAALANSTNASVCDILNVTACYTWSQGRSMLPDVECISNHIYEDYPSSSTCGSVSWTCHMKNNNEPRNSKDDTPQDLPTILNNWQNLMRTGLRLCSPTSWDGSDYWNGTGFIKNFLDSIDARGWRCDIVDAHCYWSGGFTNLANYWYPKQHRPIWISEWCWGASWNKNGAFASGVTREQVATNISNICNTLNNTGCIERYFYWNSERSMSKIYEGGLTAAGVKYAAMDTGLGYNKSYEFIPTPTRLEQLGELTGEYNNAKELATLTWTDPNGDLMNSVSVQCKLPESNTWKEIATLTPKDKDSKGGVTYEYTDTISESGVYTYRVKEVSFKATTYYTNEVSINVNPAHGTDSFQYGKISISDEAEHLTPFSERLTSSPKVFIGTITNKNITYYASNFLKSATPTQMVFNFQPWVSNSGSMKSNEEVPFMAIPEGNYDFGGLQCEVGEVKSAKSSDHYYSDVTEVAFNQPFAEGVIPIVLTEVRAPFYTTTGFNVRIFDVTNTGFKFIVYTEEEAGVKVTLAKNVEYFAIAPGVGIVDKENDVVIAAGKGTDNQIYGSTQRENRFYVENYNGTEGIQQIYAYKPAVFTAMQTNSYPALSLLRRTDMTEDVDGSEYVVGTRVKRILDRDIYVDSEGNVTDDGTGTKISRTTVSGYRDDLGWVIVSGDILIGADKEAVGIEEITNASAQEEPLRPRVENGRIIVDGVRSFEVYSLSGAKVNGNAPLTTGIYIVRSNGKSAKVLIK